MMMTALLMAVAAAAAQPYPGPPAPGSPIPGSSVPAAASPAFEIEAHADLVSDYRFRGASLSGGRAAVQGAVDVSHASGLYAGVWATSLPRSLGSAEVDLSAGYAFELGETALSVGAVAYLYPSLRRSDYLEAVASATRAFGGVELTAAAAYAPDQANLDRDDLYLALDAEYPVGETGLALLAHAGWERGPFNLTRTKWDWSAGLAYRLSNLTLTAAYTDTDEPDRLDEDDAFAPTLVAAISIGF